MYMRERRLALDCIALNSIFVIREINMFRKEGFGEEEDLCDSVYSWVFGSFYLIFSLPLSLSLSVYFSN